MDVLNDVDRVLQAAKLLLLFQVGCAMFGELGHAGAAYLSNSLAVSLFGMVALEFATFQQATNLCMIYGMLLPCMVGLDVFWIATNKASKLVIAMGILSFIARVFSVPCWMSMWQQGFLFASGNFAPVLQPDGYGGPPSTKQTYPGSTSQNPAQAPGKAPVVGGYQSIT